MLIFKKKYLLGLFFVFIALLAGAIAGYLIRYSSENKPYISQKPEKKVAAATEWTCSMHPQVRQPKFGKCPICFMDLIPVKKDSGDGKDAKATELKLSPQAEKLAEIQTKTVRRKVVNVKIRMFGKVEFDESRMAHITARMPGRIDKLFVNYTGIAVKKGDHMAEYFSPELMVAQKELLLVLKDYKMKSSNEEFYSRTTRRQMLKSVLKKFELWGLTEDNIRKIIKSGKVSDRMTLYAPLAGIVTQKDAMEGKYFETGDRLFTIADLSRVWVMLEAYETDLPWLRYGQKVQFSTEAYPDEVFEGRISFIDPVLNKETRTVEVRVDAANPKGKLKPEMFVNAVVSAKVSQSGKVIDPSLVDKWISPMHPEIIKDKPGNCDICGMKLVKAESLGYEKADETHIPLVIPATAPLITGKRAVVYLKDKNKPGVYYGKEVTLGPRAGNYYIVTKGLKEGDQVVVNGNFKIDSALQIQAKPSMMSDDVAHKHEAVVNTKNKMEKAAHKIEKVNTPLSFRQQLDKVYSAYFKIHAALAKDNLKDAKSGAVELLKALQGVSTEKLSETARNTWNKVNKELHRSAKGVAGAKDVKVARESFSILSAAVYSMAKRIGTSGKFPVYRFFCPMAFNNKGGYWLQDNPDILNPYFGDVMLKCGSKTEDVAK